MSCFGQFTIMCDALAGDWDALEALYLAKARKADALEALYVKQGAMNVEWIKAALDAVVAERRYVGDMLDAPYKGWEENSLLPYRKLRLLAVEDDSDKDWEDDA